MRKTDTERRKIDIKTETADIRRKMINIETEKIDIETKTEIEKGIEIVDINLDDHGYVFNLLQTFT